MTALCQNIKPTTLILDYGTTSLKAILYDSSFRRVAVESREWHYSYPKPGMIEFPAEKYWTITVETVSALAEKFGGLYDVDTVSVTGQSETMIFLDKDSNPMGNAIVWLDSRAEEECSDAPNHFPVNQLYAVTGNPEFNANMPVVKMQWLKKHNPELASSFSKVVLLKDFIIFRLTGVLISEHTVNCCTGYFDIVKRDWSDELLSFGGLSRQQVPPLAPSQAIIGKIGVGNASLMKCNSDAVVVNGLLDQCASAIGAGNLQSGMVCETTGTVLAIAATMDDFSPEKLKKPVLMFCHGMDGKYLALPNCPTAGVLLTWFKNTFLQEANIGFDEINDEILKRLKNPPELILLPHFSGRLSPVVCTGATGVLYGLTLKTDRMDIARSIQESVAYLLRENIELLEEIGIKTNKIVSMGGGAKSPVWEQIKASVCHCTMAVTEDEESTALGCALSAGMATGKLTPDMLPAFTKIRYEVSCDNFQSNYYDVSYKKYLQLNNALGFGCM